LEKNIAIYGVNNPDRYKIFQHSKPEELINIDLTNSIVIIDEAHKFIEKLNSDDLHLSIACSKLYVNIRNSYKRLLLTGTPIYNDLIDISYQVNLLSDKDILPFILTNVENY
jgi:SNF2 family DNA or RNA helicase